MTFVGGTYYKKLVPLQQTQSRGGNATSKRQRLLAAAYSSMVFSSSRDGNIFHRSRPYTIDRSSLSLPRLQLVNGSSNNNNYIIDAELVLPPSDDDDDDDHSSCSDSSSDSDNNNNNNNEEEEGEGGGGGGEELINLIEYSQNYGDIDYKTMPIAFCDTLSNTYIDCNLAFYVKDDNNDEEYALGVPCDIPIVVALENNSGNNNNNNNIDEEGTKTNERGLVNLNKVIPINPDNTDNVQYNDNNNNILVLSEEEKEEIFQLAARALMNEYGSGEGGGGGGGQQSTSSLSSNSNIRFIRLKKTPRVLTIEGNLDGILGDWREVLLDGGGGGGKNKNKQQQTPHQQQQFNKLELTIDDILNVIDSDDDDDDEEDFFDTIMRRDLGDDYESLIANDDDDDDNIDEELLELFIDPSYSSTTTTTTTTNIDDDDDVNVDELLTSLEEINTKEAKFMKNNNSSSYYDNIVQQLQPSAALKLLNFIGPDGSKEYTILRPLRPILLIGKDDPLDYTRRILLTEDERRSVLPRLESVIRAGLEDAGFFLPHI